MWISETFDSRCLRLWLRRLAPFGCCARPQPLAAAVSRLRAPSGAARCAFVCKVCKIFALESNQLQSCARWMESCRT